MDAAPSPAVETPLQAVPDHRPVLVDADLIVADLSDRAVRLALVLGWHNDPGPRYLAQKVSDADLAQWLRCTLEELRAAWDELRALEGPNGDGPSLPFRHACEDVDW